MELYEFKKSFENVYKDYFNKYFAGQHSFESVYLERMQNCMKSLLVAYGKFLLLLNSMKQLNKDKNFYNKCSDSQKSNIEESIVCLEDLTNYFGEILSTYVEAMKD